MSKAWRRWSERDPWKKRAKDEGYRARSAFKLKAIQRKFRLLRKGDRVVDLGAAPGGWSQVAIQHVGEDGLVIANDLKGIAPIEGVKVVRGDGTEPDVQAEIKKLAGGRVDVLLSDMAPRISGNWNVDHPRQIALAELALLAAEDLLKPGGRMAVKAFQGDLFKAFYDEMNRQFDKVYGFRPPATRDASSETFIVGVRYRGGKGETELQMHD